MVTRTIDLNSDLGEGFGPYAIADDAGLLRIVSSANIACGVHAGDPVVMDKTVRAAAANRVSIGAHVGFPDREGFGRRMMKLSLKELELATITQLGALSAVARHNSTRLHHANFHGALGNLAFVDVDVARTLIAAVKAFDRSLAFIGLPNTAAAREAEAQGVRLVHSFLADRGYSRDGIPVQRGQPGALLHEPDHIASRIRQLLEIGKIDAVDGTPIDMPIQSILIHSDTPNSGAIADAVRKAVLDAGCSVAPY
jgi:5-oxoprolinase (ATP-hydrolysing) subunit A